MLTPSLKLISLPSPIFNDLIFQPRKSFLIIDIYICVDFIFRKYKCSQKIQNYKIIYINTCLLSTSGITMFLPSKILHVQAWEIFEKEHKLVI